jgi:peptidoglycan-N-acetylglucosamine deacetylase
MAIFLIASNGADDGDVTGASRTATSSPSPVPTATAPASTGESDARGGAGKPVPEPADPSEIAAVDEDGTRRLTGVDGKNVALTFSAGPSADYTAEILAILDDYDAVATFCVSGRMVAHQPDLVEQISAGGHTLCNGTYNSDLSLRFKRPDVMEREMTMTADAIEDAGVSATVPFFRAPGGYFGESLNDVARAQGMTPLGWSVDSEDWRDKDAASIRSRVLGGVTPGAIILFSDGGGDRSATVKALPGIIEALDKDGYDFVIPKAGSNR